MLVLVTLLLLLAAVCDAVGWVYIPIAAMALAMGVENTVFERGGEVSIGLTYMTGTLVKLGQHIIVACLGGDRWAWCWYLLLWTGLVVGTIVGAAVYARIGLGGLWFVVAASACFTMVIGSLPRPVEKEY